MVVVNRKLVVNESVVCAELDGEAVLLNVDTGIYFGLDAIGAEVWKMLEEGTAENELFARLLNEYEVEPARLRADLIEFLGHLQAKGLVREASA